VFSLYRIVLPAAGLLGIASVFVSPAQIPTTLNDFFGPGTQPLTITDVIFDSADCGGCHGDFDPVTEPFRNWAASMMGQSARDPLFQAGLAIAEQDAPFVGDLCLRCHAPGGWLEGRSEPTDGSGLIAKDFQGVACHVCHRLVDPVFDPNANPPDDEAILNNLSDTPVNPHGGQYIIDPLDRRRGPFDLGEFFIHEWRQSPYHEEAQLCGNCHDVSNPAFTRQPDGSYAFNDPNTPHPTHDNYEEFPLERTFSEWLQSDFAQGPIEMGGRFGGNQTAVSTCQDCHMPETTGQACFFGESRTDLPTHYWNGGNTWVLQAVRNLYPDFETFLQDDSVAASIARAVAMLQNASDMALNAAGATLNVRITNESGHKLPTGYPEGRRMWINARFFDSGGALIRELGHYDPNSALLTTSDTKVYEAKLGLDAAMSALSGVPEGPGFHMALNNVRIKDNRIPPRGFTNANFEAIQAGPVGATYADGQHWDDSVFSIPSGAVRAEVRLLYQTASREYVEFLRDENTTNDAGQVAYDQWALLGKSAPVEMDFQTITFNCPGDIDGNGQVDLADLSVLLSRFGTPTGATPADGDIDNDGDVDLADLAVMLSLFGTVCS